MTEASDIVLYTLAFAGVAFLPIFLWNLWLAPYKILNERLDKGSDAQTPLKAVDEETERARAEGAQRARLASKTNKAIKEMKDLRKCIRFRAERALDAPHMRQISDLDYRFSAIKEKHTPWFPSELTENDTQRWAGRIIAELEAQDYDAAEKRIEEAVAKKSWKKNGTS